LARRRRLGYNEVRGVRGAPAPRASGSANFFWRNERMRTQISRRHLLKSAAAAGVGLAAMKSRTIAAGDVAFKAGLIGCGGRGNGAAGDILKAAQKTGIKVELTAVHDVYEGQAKNSARHFNVGAAGTFWDFDGYKKLIDSGVDIVILATPPGFRPEHFEAVVAAGSTASARSPWPPTPRTAAASSRRPRSPCGRI